MAWNHCGDLNQTIKIRSPPDLAKVVSVIRANLDDKTLMPEAPSAEAVTEMETFNKIGEDGSWREYVEYVFRCRHSGQPFRLQAGTYRSAVGRWCSISRSIVKTKGRCRRNFWQ
jgi:hypothetical protein